MAGRKGRNAEAVLNTFQFNVTQAVIDGIRIKSFPTYDLEWLNYVVACRRGKDYSSEYDIVEGGVANDNVIDTVEDYEKGIITAEQALGQLKYKKVNHQLCILNQDVIDKYLTFTESTVLEFEEDEP
ncbi:DUF3990 domain-containing protein [Prevotella sp. E9-3]|nr:DUF3990 domain-containing protein [Prevotella sp. E9-3]UKK47384.1 DUF3990 domain-containing protein [Prevotella sp. E9-3]